MEKNYGQSKNQGFVSHNQSVTLPMVNQSDYFTVIKVSEKSHGEITELLLAG